MLNTIADEHIICGMWGTSSLQLSLVDGGSSEILETRSGRGVSKLGDVSLEEELFSICEDWIGNFDIRGVVLGGMAGSSLGWWDVPYLQCPAALAAVAAHTSTKTIRNLNVHIAPGMKCENFLDEPDVIRGEEVELLAWLKMRPVKSQQRSLVCIPGTHTKWVEVIGDAVTKFQTSVVGEIFDVLTSNGVLASRQDDQTLCSQAFLDGVDSAVKHPTALLQLLMSVRSRSLLSVQSDAEAADRLSGLLIGADVATALKLTGYEHGKDILPVIGTRNLAERYALAIRHIGVTPLPLNALNVGVLGLFELSKQLIKGVQ